MLSSERVKRAVQERYGQAARQVRSGGAAACCQTAAVGDGSERCVQGAYRAEDLQYLPPEAISASLGCANPVALAQPAPGEVVLDLGSGGGIDVLLTARRVGPHGKVYGLDITDEMVELARENQRKAGLDNVEFLKGDIEQIPLPDGHVDLIISNCVLNLVPDKAKAFAEAYRVLKPGGRIAVADMVYVGERVPQQDADVSLDAWSACVAGALHRDEYEALLRQAGFTDVSIEIAYELEEEGCCGRQTAGINNVRLASALIKARRPR